MVVGQNYAPNDNPKQDWARRLADPEHAHISAYARGKDYHDVLKKRLKRVGRWLCQEFASLGADVKVFVDTAPIPEKALAQMAGVGWQGKHTNLVNRDYGSYLFLGVMYLSLQLPLIQQPPMQTSAAPVQPVSMFVPPMRLRCHIN